MKKIIAFADRKSIIIDETGKSCNSYRFLTKTLNEVARWLISIYPLFISLSIQKPSIPCLFCVFPANNRATGAEYRRRAMKQTWTRGEIIEALGELEHSLVRKASILELCKEVLVDLVDDHEPSPERDKLAGLESIMMTVSEDLYCMWDKIGSIRHGMTNGENIEKGIGGETWDAFI